MLTIRFLPGVPEKFHKSFLIQVAHFEPDVVNLYGEGVFPRVSLDLPRLGDEEGHYSSLQKEAQEQLARETKKPRDRPMSGVSDSGHDELLSDRVRSKDCNVSGQ